MSSSGSVITDTSFSDLTLVSRGKVRDVYATSDPDALLFVATDRISAYDVVLKNVSFARFPALFRALITLTCCLLMFCDND